MSRPYFVIEGTHNGSAVELSADPLNPQELLLTADAGTKVRVRLNEAKAGRLADALNHWYGSGVSEEGAGDTILQFRDGMAYSFTAPPEV